MVYSTADDNADEEDDEDEEEDKKEEESSAASANPVSSLVSLSADGIARSLTYF